MAPHEVIIPIAVFLSIAGVLITLIASRHKERLTMIEKGLSAEDIKALYARQVKYNPLSVLKWGILFVFVGIAILLGNYINALYNVSDGVMVGLVALFAGMALMVFYSIASKKPG